MLAHILQLPKKGVADLYQFATVYMQMHVHKIFLPHMIYVTGYWKTNYVRTLANCFLLAQLIATLIHYQFTVALMG